MKQDPARQLFNQRAAQWDSATKHNDHIIRTMLMLSDPAPHSVILDVGCGTGVLEPYLLEWHPAAILAVDYAENMIQKAREKLEHEAVKFVHADILDVLDLQTDNCFVYNAYPHFPDPQVVMAHIATLLKQGGRITISHAPGRKEDLESKTHTSLLLPAHGLLRILEPYFHVDTVIDSNVMFLVSGLKR